MIRILSFDKYEEDIRIKFQTFFNEAKFKALDFSEFLLCQQGGFYDWGGRPCIGLGEVGLNNLQKVNTINNIGSSIITNDNNYFKNNGDTFFKGNTDFENGIVKVCNIYLDIWENEWFLRTFTELLRVANGEHYDWGLDLSKLKDTGKGNFIRNEILKRLDAYPYIQEIVKFSYNSNLRNAIGHSQYHIVQGGIWLDNYGRNKYETTQGLSFEQWEKIFIFAWLIFRIVFSMLLQMATTTFLEIAKHTSIEGIPIMIPKNGGGWIADIIYPDTTGRTWRFKKYKNN